jgi:hypothetical protein
VTEISIEDVAALRRQGDFRAFLSHAAGRGVEPDPKPTLTAVESPGYRIAHVGGWPLGTAASGPTPPADTCTCPKCGGNPASRSIHQPQEGTAA